jgi:hypothetical protein
MVGELWDEGTRDLIDGDVDDELDALDDELADESFGGEDIETWRAIRRCLPCEIEAGQ